MVMVYACGTVENMPGHHLLDCRFRLWFGIPCAGCGMTHAVFLALHGHPFAALQANPLYPLILFGWLGVSVYLTGLRRQSHVWRRLLWLWVALLAVGTVVLWTARIFFGCFPVS